ncbi:hypothetical protein MARINOS108_20093 [Marinoscillum sp. 108]|nr:hypothetical protein MARINOS108_20093 [Marinoscillum sp. 108]
MVTSLRKRWEDSSKKTQKSTSQDHMYHISAVNVLSPDIKR